ncbi:MAG: hypothetical protein ACK55I_21865, partial [bacterium]
DHVDRVVLPTSGHVAVHVGGGGVPRARRADHGARGEVAGRAGGLAGLTELPAAGRVEEVHPARGRVGVDVPAGDARARAVAEHAGLDVDVATVDVDGAHEVQ